jgi:death-on-curing protein
MNKELLIDDVTHVAYALAVKYMQYDQPIAAFDLIRHQVDIGKLESAIRAPFQTSGKKYLIPDFYMRVSALFYYLSKAHALPNGNKRLAVMSLMVFMAKNGKWIKMSDAKLLDLSVMIASMDARHKNNIIDAVGRIIKEYTQRWKE